MPATRATAVPETSPKETNEPERTLQDLFGFSEFRPGQRDVIEAALEGRDVLAVMPTSGGKSLCY